VQISVFFGQFCSQSGNDPQEDLARLSYKTNRKVFFRKISFYIFGSILESCIEM
jgi:hypothetical protein